MCALTFADARIISYRRSSYRGMSCNITDVGLVCTGPYRTAARRVMSRRVTSRHITQRSALTCRVTSCHVIISLSRLWPRMSRMFCLHELWYAYPYHCQKEFYKLPTVPVSSTDMFYNLSWAWAWVWMSQPIPDDLQGNQLIGRGQGTIVDYEGYCALGGYRMSYAQSPY